ncbi:Uncharacterized protein HZ326_19281 [Fusarium oxysporum f. sp. albedinis]|nr:Uncharacterized protein HZ326_19281 [Fusarium oxysporum f. sp. albedinis]
MEHVLDLLIQDHSPRWEIREAASRNTVAIQTVVRRPGIYGNRSWFLRRTHYVESRSTGRQVPPHPASGSE